MALTWEIVEKNIKRCVEKPNKYKVTLYCGRDERGKLLLTSKVIEGNLADARKYLKLHEA